MENEKKHSYINSTAGNIIINSTRGDIQSISSEDTFITSKNGCVYVKCPKGNIIQSAESIIHQGEKVTINGVNIIKENKKTIQLSTNNEKTLNITCDVVIQGVNIQKLNQDVINQVRKFQEIIQNQEIILKKLNEIENILLKNKPNE